MQRYVSFYRLLSNLVANAFQYTPAGGQVRLILTRRPHYLLLHIQDTGIGISQENVSQIFARFYRVKSDPYSQTGGLPKLFSGNPRISLNVLSSL